MIYDIKREDKIVRLSINSNLKTCLPIYNFGFLCDSQENAELLKRHLLQELENWKKDIAQNPTGFLEPYQISKLKRHLKSWNIRKESW